MATEIILPKLGMNMETATIVCWRKNEGDTVMAGDVLADVETDKATIELEAEASGILRRCLVDAGERIEVNRVIALIGSGDEDISTIEQRISQQPSLPAPSHLTKIYDSWKQSPSSTPANNHQPDTTNPPMQVSSNTVNGVDPEAIRRRLTQRGHLKASAQPATDVTRLVIYGSGLGAKQLLEITRQRDDINVVGLIDDDLELLGMVAGGTKVLGGFSALEDLVHRHEIDGVILSFHSEVRKKVHQKIRAALDVRILPLVDPRAIVCSDVTIEDGVLIEAGAVVGPGTTLREGAIVDVGVTIAHDCMIGSFSHLSPGCSLSGVVSLTENVLVGVGAAINSTVSVGCNVIITPGSAVMNDLPDNVVVSGIPAKIIGESRRGK